MAKIADESIRGSFTASILAYVKCSLRLRKNSSKWLANAVKCYQNGWLIIGQHPNGWWRS
jgi:hypothetical protein